MEEELDPTLPAGSEEIVVERKNGERWQSYKNYYKDGKLVRTEELAVSTYSAFNGKKLVGPSPTPTIEPTATPATPPPATVTPAPVTPTPTPSPTADSTPTPSPTAAEVPEEGADDGEVPAP